tara:strand:+ start:3910 stop:4083 length:174 start_codon:yes stop_codon:yes gene_type:complete
MKHIQDIEKAYDLLRKWQSVSSRLNGDGVVALKEMESLNIQTELLLGGDNEENLGKE